MSAERKPAERVSNDCLGAVVAIERADGVMSMCSWIGDTVAVWARFDIEYPQHIPIGFLRQHLVEAITREVASERPSPWFWAAICLKAKQQI